MRAWPVSASVAAVATAFISFIAASSMAGIALGVAALIIVLSVMNGFQRDVRDRMLSVLPHIELYVPGGNPDHILTQWQALAKAAERNKEVRAAAPFVAAQGMLVRGQALRGVQVRGIDPKPRAMYRTFPARWWPASSMI